MRVVAGVARGVRLVAPPGRDVRPTTDRVRESVFNALGSRGVLQDAVVLDLFSGSGALGIEALSRGASQATFVERDSDAVAHIHLNLAVTGLADRAKVVAIDAETFLERSSTQAPFDLALADPPYAFDSWSLLLSMLQARTVVIETDRAVVVSPLWEVVRTKSYGGTLVVIAVHRHLHPESSWP